MTTPAPDAPGAPGDSPIERIGQVFVPVTDVERATAFYRDALGLPFLFTFPGMAFFQVGEVRLYLGVPEDDTFDGRATIYYRVADVPAAVAELEGRGVVFESRPHVVHRDDRHELWMAFCRDPDGNNVAVMAEVARA